MTVGQSLLIKIIEKNDINTLINLKAEDFQTEFELPVYKMCIDYYRKYGNMPPLSMIKEKFELSDVDGELEYWIDEFYKRKFFLTYDDGIQKINQYVMHGNIEDAKNEMLLLNIKLSEIGNFSTTLVERDKLIKDVIDDLGKRRILDGILGIPTGWPSITNMLRGFVGGNIYVIAGRKKMGKTQILIYMSDFAYKNGYNVMVISMEMTKNEYANRLLSISSGIGLNYIASGKISSPLEDALKSYSSSDGKYIFLEGFFKTSVMEIEHLIAMHKPDIVFIDGAYLVKPAITGAKMQGWERVAETVMELKIAAGKYKIPIVCSYQFNREGDIHLSDAISQIATAVMGIYETKDNVNTRLIKVIDNRNGPRGETMINFNFNKVDFSEIESIDESYCPLEDTECF